MNSKKLKPKDAPQGITIEALEKLALHLLELVDEARLEREIRKKELAPDLEQLATMAARFLPATLPHTEDQVSEALQAAVTIYAEAHYIAEEHAAVYARKRISNMHMEAPQIEELMDLNTGRTSGKPITVMEAVIIDMIIRDQYQRVGPEAARKELNKTLQSWGVPISDSSDYWLMLQAEKESERKRLAGNAKRMKNLKQEKAKKEAAAAKKAAAERIQGHLDKPANKPTRRKK